VDTHRLLAVHGFGSCICRSAIIRPGMDFEALPRQRLLVLPRLGEQLPLSPHTIHLLSLTTIPNPVMRIIIYDIHDGGDIPRQRQALFVPYESAARACNPLDHHIVVAWRRLLCLP
jgi:hypothetical protein